ncbi:MAG: tRNA lysidine(34) synthetase TilS [Vicinamibacterales bacterium]
MLGALHQQVRRTIRRYDLLPAGSRVVVALSGGSDSVALTRLLADLSTHGGFVVAGCAHLNHGLRATADRDEAFCRTFAASRALQLQVGRADVAAYAAENGLSIEAAARKIRYSYLDSAAADLGADCIASGHTRDDQAETFLMKLMRGAGQAGLGGIYPRRGALIRPLLDVSREELRDWLRAGGQDWVEDETNADLENPRNRIRISVLPELAKALGGDPRPSIARAAALLREDGEWLDATAEREFDRLVAGSDRGQTGVRPGSDQGQTLDAAQLLKLPPPVEARVLRLALGRLAGDREVTLEHVELARAVLRGQSAAVDVPGGRVELSRSLLVLLDRKAGPK